VDFNDAGLTSHKAMNELRQTHLDSIRAEVAAGVVDGMQAILSDEKFVASFWEKGYQQLAKHGTAGASEWFGKRLLTGFVIAVTVAGIVWLTKNGAIK